jgi:hypothetical protein
MALRETEIDALARHLVEGLVARGSIKPKADTDALVACVVEMMSDNFETELGLDDEADKMAEAEARKHPGVDLTRLRMLIKQRLAEKKGFTI